jgi:hypothetical protein
MEHWLWFCLITLGLVISINMIYIAVLFLCLKGECHVMSSETLYKNEKECRAVIAQEEEKQKGRFDIFEARCIGVNNGFI